MTSYYCIVNLPGAPCREIAAVSAGNDATARTAAQGVADRWPGFETVELYEGERPVAVLANPSLGFSVTPLVLWDQAA